MNIFSAFNFGKIIKIVLPGFFALLGLVLMVDSWAKLSFGHNMVLDAIKANASLAILFSIPLMLACGMTCNIVFFTFLSEKWFGRWFAAAYPEIDRLRKMLFKGIQEAVIGGLRYDEDVKNALNRYGNAAGFLLQYVDLERFYFLQESYWSYFEYHVNMLLAVAICYFGFLWWFFAQGALSSLSGVNIVVTLLFLGLSGAWFVVMTIKAARLNYYKFQIKQLSYFASLVPPLVEVKADT